MFEKKRAKLKYLLVYGDLIIVFLPYILFYIYTTKNNFNAYSFLVFLAGLTLSYYFLYKYFLEKNFYKHQRVLSTARDVKIIIKAILNQFVVFLTFLFLLKDLYLQPFYLTASCFIAAGLLIIDRIIIRRYQFDLRKRGHDIDNLILIGHTNSTNLILNKISGDLRYGFRFLNIFSIEELISDYDKIKKYVFDNNVKEIIMTNPGEAVNVYKKLCEELKQNDINCYIVPDTYNIITSVTVPFTIKNLTLLKIINTPQTGIMLIVKRIIDILLSLIIIILLLPFLVMISILIKFDSPGPILFKQIRVGKNGKHFIFYKFRTMCSDAEKKLMDIIEYNEAQGPIFKMKKDPRVTDLGAFLRKFSIDELPQLINVLKGDMSIIGPRPPLPSEVEKYYEWQKRRFSTLPGITGLWQVRGRSDLSFDEMVKLDIYYIENWTVGIDLYILLKTIPAVLTARGSY